MVDDLDDRIAAAMREHYLNASSEEQTADGGLPCSCGDWWEGSIEEPDDCDWAAHLAEVAAGVVQAELDRLSALLADHATCARCGHERHQHGREPILRHDWCRGCGTHTDLHTFKPEEQP